MTACVRLPSNVYTPLLPRLRNTDKKDLTETEWRDVGYTEIATMDMYLRLSVVYEGQKQEVFFICWMTTKNHSSA